MTCALLTLYLAHIAQQGFVLASSSVAGIVLGAGMILLPIRVRGRWCVRCFSAPYSAYGSELAASNELVEDNRRAPPSGRVDRRLRLRS